MTGGVITEGEYKHGVEHGLFATYFPNGRVQFGMRVDGIPDGICAAKDEKEDKFSMTIFKKGK